ncbi:unnamed protein product [Protopolystoma xenopodis]|uniref:Uncharacterized protein n=1 Tax=Protopolystoma xenopodis TaxID=117903 RepID=A0A448WGF3_9PLAT|nr:unnamed protein product [Protopolystoma xenopodis]
MIDSPASINWNFKRQGDAGSSYSGIPGPSGAIASSSFGLIVSDNIHNTPVRHGVGLTDAVGFTEPVNFTNDLDRGDLRSLSHNIAPEAVFSTGPHLPQLENRFSPVSILSLPSPERSSHANQLMTSTCTMARSGLSCIASEALRQRAVAPGLVAFEPASFPAGAVPVSVTAYPSDHTAIASVAAAAAAAAAAVAAVGDIDRQAGLIGQIPHALIAPAGATVFMQAQPPPQSMISLSGQPAYLSGSHVSFLCLMVAFLVFSSKNSI